MTETTLDHAVLSKAHIDSRKQVVLTFIADSVGDTHEITLVMSQHDFDAALAKMHKAHPTVLVWFDDDGKPDPQDNN